MHRGARCLRSNLVSPTLIGMPAPATPAEEEGAGDHLTIVGAPPGPPGASIARGLIEQALTSARAPFAFVPDPGPAIAIVQPHLPLEDPRTAVVLLTSGSTGDPKAVCWSRENLLAMSAMWRDRYPELTDAPRVAALPVTTAGGLGVIIRAVIDDAPIVTVESIGGAGRFTSEVFANAIRPVAGDGPVVSLVPTQVALLLRDEVGQAALRAMRRVFLGGSAAPARLLTQARDLGIDITTTYGMTETCGGCVHDGEPLEGVSVRVDDGGRIHLAGAMCALGYRLRPDDTATSFTGNTFATGDIGAWDGHRLSVLGRIDDIVQIRGINVAIGAVERAIVDSGLVREAVVIPVSDEVDGTHLHALVIPDHTSAHDSPESREQAIEQVVRERLGGIAVPRTVRSVSVLPYLPGGKIDRRIARALLTTDELPPTERAIDARLPDEGN